MRYTSVLLFLLFSFIFEGSGQLQVVKDIQYKFDPHPIEAVNTNQSEFGPIWYDFNLIFSSTREHDYLNIGENQWKNKKQYNLYIAQIHAEDDQLFSDSIQQLKFFDDQLNTYLHTGPACFSQTGDTLFFTQVIKTKQDKKKVYRPVLYVTFRKKNGAFEKPEMLSFVKTKFNYAHPTFDSPNKKLYFSSNCDSTKEDEDIYVAQWKDDGTWSTPENLGPSVNTDQDEMFPFIFRGNELFFASDRKEGSGGLDLYWSYKKPEGWENTRNLGTTINSNKDDFSFSMHPNGKYCFLASDRGGNDDLFFSQVDRKIITGKKSGLKGQFVYRHLSKDAKGLEVQLVDEDGIVLEETITDSMGNFQFDKLKDDQSFLIRMKSETDDELILKIFDKEGKKVAVLLSNDGSEFTYKKLDPDEADILSLLDTDEDEFDLEGQFLYEKLPGEFPNGLEVKIVNEDDEVLYTTTTDEMGNFKFKKLSSDQQMYLTLNESQGDDFILLIYNNNGDVIARLTRGEDDEFNYRRLQHAYQNNLEMMTNEEDELLMEQPYQRFTGEIDFKKLDGFFEEGLQVVVFDDELMPLDTVQSTQTGQFVFEKLDVDQKNLSFKVIGADSYEKDDLFFYKTNRKGERQEQYHKNEKGFFKLKSMDQIASNIETKDDFDDTIQMDISDDKETQEETHTNEESQTSTVMSKEVADHSIFFDLNSSYFNAKNKSKLKELIPTLKNSSKKIEIHSYADSRASDHYNDWLSKRRSDRVYEYLIQNGVPTSRISKNHYGESKLFNKCADGVECPEDMHQLNRRTEIIMK